MNCALFLLMMNSPQIGNAATIPTITTTTLTIAAIKTQILSVAKSANVSTDTVIVDGWMAAGSIALQTDNSDAHVKDTPCPVELARSGIAISTFSAYFDNINSDAKFIELSTTVPQQIKLVSIITVCGGRVPTPPDTTFNGCTNKTQIVLAMNAPLTPESLAHEYGHYKGLDYDRGAGFDRWIMYGKGKPNRNIVDATECSAFSR